MVREEIRNESFASEENDTDHRLITAENKIETFTSDKGKSGESDRNPYC